MNSVSTATNSSVARRAQNSAGPTAQPERKPGAAWDFEIEETTIVRSARSGSAPNCPGTSIGAHPAYA